MNLKPTLLALTTLALAAGAAQAQTVPVSGNVGAGSYNISATSASVSQTITVTVPKRFGLHLHRSSWTLNLNNVQGNGTGSEGNPDIKCFRAGDHSSGSGGTGRDFLYYAGSATDTSSKDVKILSLLNGAKYEGDQIADTAGNAYSYLGNLTWPTVNNATTFNPNVTTGTGTTATTASAISNLIGGYPGFYVSGGNLVWKGSIMCSFQTIVQKFSNSTNGFNFTAGLTTDTGTTPGKTFPTLYVRDFIKGNTSTSGITTSSVFLTSGAAAQTLASGAGTTGGWLDDHLLQVLVFDGTETDGTYVGNVKYTLTDLTPPVTGGPVTGGPTP